MEALRESGEQRGRKSMRARVALGAVAAVLCLSLLGGVAFYRWNTEDRTVQAVVCGVDWAFGDVGISRISLDQMVLVTSKGKFTLQSGTYNGTFYKETPGFDDPTYTVGDPHRNLADLIRSMKGHEVEVTYHGIVAMPSSHRREYDPRPPYATGFKAVSGQSTGSCATN